MKRLFAENYDERLLLDAGLLRQDDKGAQCFARFRNRLMFPIRNLRGQTIAFGGRVLTDKDQPKYLNSPETPVFQKRRTVYGIHELRRVRNLESIVVVEGYTDTLALARCGIENVTATLGTAVTREHAQQLFRLCNTLTFCFDGDAAGHRAAATALRQVLPVLRDGRAIRFMLLPEGEDPDSLVCRVGQAAFAAQLRTAIPLSGFLFQRLAENSGFGTPRRTCRFQRRGTSDARSDSIRHPARFADRLSGDTCRAQCNAFEVDPEPASAVTQIRQIPPQPPALFKHPR